MHKIEKVLVANRGEIARRVFRTLREMGVASVAVYSDADADAPHVAEADEAVRIGAAPSLESYLDIDRVLDAAQRCGADAVHPGYGFLAENAEFAERCAEAGLVFIGPPVEAIRRMGSKIEAKKIMAEAGVPVIPGFSAVGLSDDEVGARVAGLGFPILVKASAGGGGKGMRIVREVQELVEALQAARREAAGAFGDDTLLIESYFDSPRHIEMQIFGDDTGRVIHCLERECYIQRRYQKIIEEAPSPFVDEKLRIAMGEAAVAAGKAIGYVGAGTVEFIVDAQGDFYFLEVNTRLQVEHPVTEMITGLDLVRLQIETARGLPLAVDEGGVSFSGHAIEARLYAEDPANEFLPATGVLSLWNVPELPGLRCDSGVEQGSEISVHYDPLLAKLIAWGSTREEARLRLINGLRALAVAGLGCNRDFLLSLLTTPAFVAAELDTHFIDRHLPPESRSSGPNPEALRTAAIATVLHEQKQRRACGVVIPPSLPPGWRNNRWRAHDRALKCGERNLEVFYVAKSDSEFEVGVREPVDAVEQAVPPFESEKESLVPAIVHDWDDSSIVLELDGLRRRYLIADDGERASVHSTLGSCDFIKLPRFPIRHSEELAGGCVAPMTGIIREVKVSVGDKVSEGSLLLVLEAMKMEQQLLAHGDGVVSEVRVEVGQMVDPDDVLIVVEADE